MQILKTIILYIKAMSYSENRIAISLAPAVTQSVMGLLTVISICFVKSCSLPYGPQNQYSRSYFTVLWFSLQCYNKARIYFVVYMQRLALLLLLYYCSVYDSIGRQVGNIIIYFECIDRPEATTPIPQQAVHGRGLTAYDTVAV